MIPGQQRYLYPINWKLIAENFCGDYYHSDGARLSTLLSPSALKLAVGLLLLAPNIPLLFMGEEFCEKAPFYYFISHTDPGLVEAVRQGRKKETEGQPGQEVCSTLRTHRRSRGPR